MRYTSWFPCYFNSFILSYFTWPLPVTLLRGSMLRWTICDIFIHIVTCQRCRVSEEPPWLRAVTRHRSVLYSHYSVCFSGINLCVWKCHVWSIAQCRLLFQYLKLQWMAVSVSNPVWPFGYVALYPRATALRHVAWFQSLVNSMQQAANYACVWKKWKTDIGQSSHDLRRTDLAKEIENNQGLIVVQCWAKLHSHSQ